LYGAVSVVRSVVAAAIQPAYAKVSDIFGRDVTLVFAIVMYVIGTIVEALCVNVQGFAGGAILYQIGYSGLILLVEILIADTTSLRNRLLFSYIPATPFIINTWVSGNIIDDMVGTDTSNWRWGIGMWAIIIVVASIPLLAALLVGRWRASRPDMAHEEGELNGVTAKLSYFLRRFRGPQHLKSTWKVAGWKTTLVQLSWQIDLVGLLLLCATFAMILVPFTLAGGVGAVWAEARIIAPLVIGVVVVLPVWIYWELRVARHPIIPISMMKDRMVIAGLIVALWLNFTWYMQGDFLYPVLIIAFDESVLSANRITMLYSFVSVITGCCVGLVIRYVRYLKWFIVFGVCMWIVAFGLLIQYRGQGYSGTNGMIGAQCLLGFAGGFFPYGTQALVQSASRHENLASITALYLASYNIGSALGVTISTAMWRNILPDRLIANIGTELGTSVYADPYTFANTYPIGTPERDGAAEAYTYIQRLLCIAGLCLSIPLLGAVLALRNPRLGDEQTLANPSGKKQLDQVSSTDSESTH